jgi:Asp-tRNA(Asn)/Glu-tRNA(Gln) amidotransferase A subunit family amidase
MSVAEAWLDPAAASALMARGELSAVELVEHMLARIERLNPAFNA